MEGQTMKPEGAGLAPVRTIGTPNRRRPRGLAPSAAALAIAWIASVIYAGSQTPVNDRVLADLLGVTNPTAAFDNASGKLQTVSLDGAVDTQNPFFEDFGTNGRACVTCHAPR